VTTLSGAGAEEFIFGFSNSAGDTRQLILEVVPEPASMALLGTGLLMGAYKARRRARRG
jgi:hypothetical protein